MNIAIICGGPGAERGISINSARSAGLDHLQSDDIKISVYYFDVFMNIYRLYNEQLRSNTPSDFDFKLKNSAQKISKPQFIQELKKFDLAYPIIHGIFGEDGQLQQLLEDNGIRYIGGTAQAYKNAFPKDIANEILGKNGFYVIPSAVVDRNDLVGARPVIESFFKTQKLTKAVIKPTLGGSSIGTYEVDDAAAAIDVLKEAVAQELHVGDKFILEPFCEGREFSAIVIQNKHGEPVSFVPTEVEMVRGSKIFNFRKKYLATDSSLLHCPPRFSDTQIRKIQKGAEKIFSLFGFNDILRIDGWILDNDQILFSDINPVSGMEQNSFMFEQTSRVGFTHASLLRHIVSNACRRYGIPAPSQVSAEASEKKKKVYIPVGWYTAERQVSLMSGSNVWLKLKNSKKYAPTLFLIDKKDESVWELPYSFGLNHTVEEICLNCKEADQINAKLKPLAAEIYRKLDMPNGFSVEQNTPKSMSLDAFFSLAAKDDAFVFVGLHGGKGENGWFQKRLEDHGLVYNGSGPEASRICMDKVLTGQRIDELNDPDIRSLPKVQFNIRTATEKDLEAIWKKVSSFNAESLAIKPLSDGCSSGIVRLYTFDDLKKYAKIAANPSNDVIPAGSFANQDNEVSLPQDRNPEYFIEPFIMVDYIRVVNNDIVYRKNQGWLEFTVGVVEKNGKYHSLSPSITIAEGEVLSLEEKFQGGTGVNITPPPNDILKPEFREKLKAGNEKVSAKLDIKNYARNDVFFNVDTGKMVIIESNTLPGMTPATVIYHQALAENPPLEPLQFIEMIIDNKLATEDQAGHSARKAARG